MRLLVGLGNPGSEYQRTRHNAGYMALARLAQRWRLGDFATDGRSKFHSLALEGAVAGEKCLLLQPITYMNRSGLAVGEAAAFYKIAPKDVLVLVDDWALPLGRIRLRGEGSAGSHNGLADIERALGGPEYRRLRIGIAPGNSATSPGAGSATTDRTPAKGADFVLGRFTDEQYEQLQGVLEQACDCVEIWIKDGLAKAMSRFNAQ